MKKLSKFYNNKIRGFANFTGNSENKALDYFLKAVEYKEDGFCYHKISLCYCYLREYKLAQEYALKSIKCGYSPAYNLFKDITIGNLQDFDSALKVLKEGAERKDSHAYLCLANIYGGGYTMSCPPIDDHYDQFEMVKCLDNAFKFAKFEEKGEIAYSVASLYRYVNWYKKEEIDKKILKYLKLANKYGVGKKTINPLIFEYCSDKKMPYSKYLDGMFERFDGEEYLIFGLLIVKDDLEHKKKISVDKDSEAWMLFDAGLKHRNGGCAMLCALRSGSNLNGAQLDSQITERMLKTARNWFVAVPNCLKDTFKSLISNFNDEFKEMVISAGGEIE